MTGKYPLSPGFADTDTSRAAAKAVKPTAAFIRAKVIEALEREGPMTTAQIARATKLPYETVQPRTSEAKELKLIVDSGLRGPSRDPSKTAIVWAVAPPAPPAA